MSDITVDPSAVYIREFTPFDHHAVMTIWFETGMSTKLVSEKEMRNFQAAMHHEILPKWEKHVAMVYDKVVGYIALDRTFVGGLFVSPNYQGLGIGRKLLDHAVRLHGALKVSVYANNTRAKRFYENYGFVGIKQRYDSDFNLLEWLMEMPSAPSADGR